MREGEKEGGREGGVGANGAPPGRGNKKWKIFCRAVAALFSPRSWSLFSRVPSREVSRIAKIQLT